MSGKISIFAHGYHRFFSNTKIVTLGKNPAGFIPLFSALDFFVYRTAIFLKVNQEVKDMIAEIQEFYKK